MKCPSCNGKLSKVNISQDDGDREFYKCPSCGMVSVPKHGLLFFIILVLIGFPVIELILRLFIEPFLFWLLGDATVGSGWELARIISFLMTLIVTLMVFLKLNTLVPYRQA